MKIGRFSRLLVITLCSFILSGQVLADTIKVAGIYTQPLQQKWDARLHLALQAQADAGEIEYVFSEKVSNTEKLLPCSPPYPLPGSPIRYAMFG